MIWRSMAVLLMLATFLPRAAQAQVHRCSVSGPANAGGDVSLERAISVKGAVSDHATFRLRAFGGDSYGASIGLTREALYTGRADAVGGNGSTVTIVARVTKKEDYVVRLYGAGGAVDFPVGKQGDTASVILSVADFDARFGGGDVLDVAVVTLFKDGSKYEAPSQRFDLTKLRRGYATVASLRGMLDALPPGPATSCVTDSTNEEVTFNFDCSRQWTDDQGTFAVSSGKMNWRGAVAPDVFVELSTGYSSGGVPATNKSFFVNFVPPGEQKLSLPGFLWVDGRTVLGDYAKSDLSDTMAGTAPVWITLTKPGGPDRRIDLPPTLLKSVITKLFAAWRAVREDEDSPVGKCKVSRYVNDPTNMDIVT